MENISQFSIAAGGTVLIERLLGLWPFIIALVIFLLLILWYQNLQLNRRRSATPTRHRKGLNAIIILGIVTVFILIMLAIPWFISRLDDAANNDVEQVAPSGANSQVIFNVEGMTCTGCENAVKNRVEQLRGVTSVEANHTNKTTRIDYDSLLVDQQQIADAIRQVGYIVLDDTLP
jgi:mercuric ion transport protein